MTKPLRDNKKSFTVFVQNLPKFKLRQKGKKQLCLRFLRGECNKSASDCIFSHAAKELNATINAVNFAVGQGYVGIASASSGPPGLASPPASMLNGGAGLASQPAAWSKCGAPLFAPTTASVAALPSQRLSPTAAPVAALPPQQF